MNPPNNLPTLPPEQLHAPGDPSEWMPTEEPPTGVEARVCGWRPIETAPKDGTPFVWLHYVTVLSTPVEYKPYATVIRRHWIPSNVEKSGGGFWMGQYTSYGDQELERGWWQPLPPPPAERRKP